jgi:hypothetical protein
MLRSSDSLANNNYLSTRCAWNPLAVFDSECWASTYEALQYGRITRPGDVPAPVPAAPQTADQMTDPGAWTPEDGTGELWTAYAERLRAQIAADTAAGNYDPAGRLPASASDISNAFDLAGFWDEYKLAIIGAGILGAAALYAAGAGAPRRYAR